jgi:hypothetical protein
MHPHTLFIPLALSTALFFGCGGSAGFQQSTPREPVSAPPQVNDGEVAAAFGLRAQLPRPYRLGVVFRDPPGELAESPWRWEPEQRQELLRKLEALERSGEVASVFTITRGTVAGDDLHAIRVAAARHGADAVLVVSGEDEAEHDWNAWAASYVALLPVLFAPAAELQVRFVAHAELWDVRNEFLYMAAEGEARAEQQRAVLALDHEEGAATAQREALALLGGELEKRLSKLHAGATATP